MALALTTQTVHTDLRTKRLYLIATPSGNYVTGGDTVDLTSITPALGQQNATVGYPGNIKDFAVISAPAGYTASLVKGTTLKNWKLQVLQSAGGTPAGTISAPTITTLSGDPTVAPVGVVAGHLAQTAGAAGITGVQAPVFTGTPAAAGGLSELPAAAYPAGVLAGTFIIMVEGPKLQM